MDKVAHNISKHRLKITLTVSALVVLGLLIRLYDFIDLGAIVTFVEDLGFMGIFVYGLIYFILSLVGISTAVLTVFAGTLFGVVLGMGVAITAATASATVAFYVARYAKKRLRTRFGGRNTNQGIVHRIESTADTSGFSTIALMRLSFLPYIPVSYGAGLVDSLRFHHFFWATFLKNIFGAFVFVFLGASFREGLPFFLAAVALVIVYMLLSKRIKRKNRNAR
ncbi:MAG: VTT domain-containing protein [Candidatus Saccharimonadales bacterium]